MNHSTQHAAPPADWDELHARLQEAEETIRAIRHGEVDAVLVSGPDCERVYTLEGADHGYRVLVERMNEGAISLGADGTILYCNRRFGAMLGSPSSAVMGSTFQSHLLDEGGAAFRQLLFDGSSGCSQGDFRLRTVAGAALPVQISIAPLLGDSPGGVCLVVTDLSLRERNEEIVRSERLARSILEQVADAIVVCDRDGRVTRASEAAGELSSGHPLGRSFDVVFPLVAGSDPGAVPPDGAGAGRDPSLIGPALAGEKVLGREATLRREDARVVDLLVNAGPLRGARGEVLGCVVSLTDITVRKRAEEGIREAKAELEARVEERTLQLRDANRSLLAELTERVRVEASLRKKTEVLRSVFDSMADAVIVAEEAEPFVVCNPAASRMLGIGPAGIGLEEWFTIPWLFASEESDALPARESPLWRVMHGEDVNTHELFVRPLQARGGLWASVNGRPVRDQGGTPRGGVVVYHDVSGRKQAELELELRSQELARSNAELERFAYVASHDLQEPLRMVGSFTQLLARRYQGRLDDKADQYIGFAVDGVNRMQQLIRDLLDYSRAGARAKPMGPVDCEVVLSRCVADLRAAIEEAGATVTHDPLPTVTGDESQFGQLLMNLIGNALKFRSAEPSLVHVSARKEEGVWTFCVRDNGIGIDPQYKDRVFVLFQRLHTRDEHPGTGIGLSISKKIVERHDGRIWVESRPGRGAQFYFTIPDGAAR